MYHLHTAILVQFYPSFDIAAHYKLMLGQIEYRLLLVLVVHVLHNLQEAVFAHNRTLATLQRLSLPHIHIFLLENLPMLLKLLNNKHLLI